ncbi:MAG TPA: zf-HC2 domain-containing protein [Candidatus Xenobia bacterium]|nr:zf-HC2 domain-containing protein [Candidatus Xenobia bacterium]
MTEHDHENLVRYSRDDLTTSQRVRVEEHLKDCAECNRFLSFVNDLRTALKEIAQEESRPETPCPDAETLVAFDREELDEERAELIREHTVFCKDCLEELYLLRRARQSPQFKEMQNELHDIAVLDVVGRPLDEQSDYLAEALHKAIDQGYKKILINSAKGKTGILVGYPTTSDMSEWWQLVRQAGGKTLLVLPKEEAKKGEVMPELSPATQIFDTEQAAIDSFIQSLKKKSPPPR